MTGEVKQQALSDDIFHCRNTTGINVSASDKLSPEQVRDRLCNLTGLYINSENFRNGNKNNPGNCYGQL